MAGHGKFLDTRVLVYSSISAGCHQIWEPHRHHWWLGQVRTTPSYSRRNRTSSHDGQWSKASRDENLQQKLNISIQWLISFVGWWHVNLKLDISAISAGSQFLIHNRFYNGNGPMVLPSVHQPLYPFNHFSKEFFTTTEYSTFITPQQSPLLVRFIESHVGILFLILPIMFRTYFTTQLIGSVILGLWKS